MSTDDQFRNDREIPSYPQAGPTGQGASPQGGYQQGGYQQGGYQQGGYQQGQPVHGNAAPLNPEYERQLVCAAHWSPIASVLLGGLTFFGPVIVLLVGGGRSRAVREHAIDALNFQITVWIATVAVVLISLPLMIVLVGFVTIWLAGLLPLAALVVHGLAAIKVSAGEPYSYPFTWRLIT